MSSLLRFGFLADRALLMLAGVDAQHPKVSEPELISQIEDFLQLTAQSFAAEAPTPTPAAGAGARAVAYLDWDSIASGERIEDGDRFVAWIGHLKDVAGHVRDSKAVATNDLDQLKSFLAAVGRLSLTQAQSLRQSAESGKARESWQLASRS